MKKHAALVLMGSFAFQAAAAQSPGGIRKFSDEVAFLQQHTDVVVLRDESGAQVAVAPAYQGRVMTSTAGGGDALSFGWIGRAAVASRSKQPHMNVFGGEDRFWLGPEGGQYSFFFKKGDPFDLDHWQVPEPIDWSQWKPAAQNATSVSFRQPITLTNYSGSSFSMQIDRVIRLLTRKEIGELLGGAPSGSVRVVAYESSNTVTNSGRTAWSPSSGLPSIWILGMYNPSAQATIVLPYVPGSAAALGPVVNDAYFGKVPATRLLVQPAAVLFKADGRYRSKIGLSPKRAGTVAGSYDGDRHALTLVQYTRPAGLQRYVNSMWEIQKDPFSGDVVNAYNDGPPAPGKPPLGPFYELETSSPALSLGPGERYTHVHRTFHFVGTDAELAPIAQRMLHVSLADLRKFAAP